MDFDAKVSLITGASRGIGAAVARQMAQPGCNVILNYRSKGARAMEVAAELQDFKVRVLPIQADITDADEVRRMMGEVKRDFGRLNYLVLNASGGLEKGKSEGYAMQLNRDAQVELVKEAVPLMPSGSRIVFVTSHWAHFYGVTPVMPYYEPVAKSKRAGEDELRAYSSELDERGISLVVVSGDLIEGTITSKLLERNTKGLIEARRKVAGDLTTVEDFAEAIVAAAGDDVLPSGHTIYVGSSVYAKA